MRAQRVGWIAPALIAGAMLAGCAPTTAGVPVRDDCRLAFEKALTALELNGEFLDANADAWVAVELSDMYALDVAGEQMATITDRMYPVMKELRAVEKSCTGEETL